MALAPPWYYIKLLSEQVQSYMEYTFEESMEWSFSSACMTEYLADWSKLTVFYELSFVLKREKPLRLPLMA